MNIVFTYGIQLAVGIILARLLSPEQFGLIGMTAIFTAIAQSFVDSGFSAALIRKKNCTQSEYSTVFYYNMLIAIIFYSLLYLAAPYISRFFDEEKLTLLVRVIGINIVIMAIAQIQRTILIKQMNFKRLTKVTIVSSIISGEYQLVWPSLVMVCGVWFSNSL